MAKSCGVLGVSPGRWYSALYSAVVSGSHCTNLLLRTLHNLCKTIFIYFLFFKLILVMEDIFPWVNFNMEFLVWWFLLLLHDSTSGLIWSEHVLSWNSFLWSSYVKVMRILRNKHLGWVSLCIHLHMTFSFSILIVLLTAIDIGFVSILPTY